VQFQVRDAAAAHDDLKSLLRQDRDRHGPARGGLVFTCNGRGSRMFGGPHHDVQCVVDAVGSVPLAGFFAAGELGPVGGVNHIHGFTASVVLFD
jgi:small ligand-binding sensory domain FIST